MLHITKTILPPIDNPYAVGYLTLNGEQWGICASGSRGISIAFPADHPELAAEQRLSQPNWGAQMFCQVNGDAYFAIQGFLPEYHCEKAGLVRVSKHGEDWIVEKCFDMPFLHKIAVVFVERQPYLVGATLSGPKAFTEDWSNPGAVLAAPIPSDPVRGPWEFQRLLYPMTKNHGFCKTTRQGKDTLFFSAKEGVFALTPPERPGGAWDVQKVLNHEIGDLTVLDPGGLVAAVDGFHGNQFSIYRKAGDSIFARELSTPIVWGHTAWIGQIGGIPVAVAGELNGEARILFYADYGRGFTLIHCEQQIGPFSVCPRKIDDNTTELLCPARASGHPVLYRISAD